MGLRKRTGGYNANSFLFCYVETIGTYIIISFIIPFLAANRILIYIGVIFAAILICRLGCVNHPNMHMSKEELAESKKVARVVIFIEFFVFSFLDLIGIEMVILSYMAVAIMLCAILLFVAVLLQQEVKE